jgi:hypothetical protein
MHYSEEYIRTLATQHPLPQYPQFLLFDVELSSGDTAFDPKNDDKWLAGPEGVAFWIEKATGEITISSTSTVPRIDKGENGSPPAAAQA